MADLILFHHVLGLTDGVRSFAERLRSAGHTVTLPDLFDGTTFESVEAGLAFAEHVGFDSLIAAGMAAAEEHPEGIVYGGFSLGALIAHKLAQTTTGARGALLYHHGDVPLTTFGDTWPSGVDLQIHVAAQDEFYEPAVVDEFIEQAGRVAVAQLFLYPGSHHLFADSSLDDYQADSAAILIDRSLDFLASHG